MTLTDPDQTLQALEPLLSRRSAKVFGEAGPTDVQIDAILRAAVTVPDHGGLRPWRLVVVRDDARSAFGDALADAGREADPSLRAEVADRLRSKAFVAPALIAVVAKVDRQAKVEVWEQVASAACAGYAIALAADRLGLGAMWKSSTFRTGARLRAVLDMSPDDEFLGWVNLGARPNGDPVAERQRVDLGPIVRTLTPAGEPVAYTARA